MKKAASKIITIFGFTAIALELIYLSAVNVLLNSHWFKQEISPISDESYSLQYDTAWTFYPGKIHLKKVTLKNTEDDFSILWKLNNVVASVQLHQLLKKTFSTNSIIVDEAEIEAQVTRFEPSDVRKNREFLTQRTKWLVNLRNIKIKNVHELSLNGFIANKKSASASSSDSALSLYGGIFIYPSRYVDVYPSKLEVKQVGIKKENSHIIRDLFGALHVTYIDRLAAQLYCSAKIEDLDFLNRYLNNKFVLISNGRGTLSAKLNISNKTILKNSFLRMQLPQLTGKVGKTCIQANTDFRLVNGNQLKTNFTKGKIFDLPIRFEDVFKEIFHESAKKNLYPLMFSGTLHFLLDQKNIFGNVRARSSSLTLTSAISKWDIVNKTLKLKDTKLSFYLNPKKPQEQTSFDHAFINSTVTDWWAHVYSKHSFINFNKHNPEIESDLLISMKDAKPFLNFFLKESGFMKKVIKSTLPLNQFYGSANICKNGESLEIKNLDLKSVEAHIRGLAIQNTSDSKPVGGLGVETKLMNFSLLFTENGPKLVFKNVFDEINRPVHF